MDSSRFCSGVYSGRVAHENVVALRVRLVSSRCFPYLLYTFALSSIYSYLPSRTYYIGITPFYSLNVLFLKLLIYPTSLNLLTLNNRILVR